MNEKPKAIYENGIWMKASDQQSDDRNHRRNDEEFICACDGLKCEGICRDTHLYRQRGAWIQTEKFKGRCPEAIEKNNRDK